MYRARHIAIWALAAMFQAPAPSDAAVKRNVTWRSEGRGIPWVILHDGVDVPLGGTATEAQGGSAVLADPLSLAGGDFDGDGIADLVCGYASATGGVLTLHHGNPDAIYPDSAPALQRKATGTFTDAPFADAPRMFQLPDEASFLGTGDFDNDGHPDVVTAAAGGSAVYLLRGNGVGGLAPPERLGIPGAITALTTGEVNRADGLVDIVVAIVEPQGPAVLVFEGPHGALRSEPERIALPAPATDLALARLDGSGPADLAVAADSDLVIVHGRDRRLIGNETDRGEVLPPIIESRHLPFAIVSLTVGEFLGDSRKDIALLGDDGLLHLLTPGDERVPVAAFQVTAAAAMRHWSDLDHWWTGALPMLSDPPMPRLSRASAVAPPPRLVTGWVSSLPQDNVVLVDPAHRQVRIVHQLHWRTVVPEALQGGVLATPTQAWLESHAVEPVAFDLDDEPVAVLPMRLNADALSDLVVLTRGPNPLAVGTTASGHTFHVNSSEDWRDKNPGDGKCESTSRSSCTLRAAIEEANAAVGMDGIFFDVSLIQIGSGAGPGYGLPYIEEGLLIDGGPARVELRAGPNVLGAVLEFHSGGNEIRHLVINGLPSLIRIQSGTFAARHSVVEACYLGTDLTGTVARGGAGIELNDSLENTIGGLLPDGGLNGQAMNVISGNNNFISGALAILGDKSSDNEILGNLFGTDASGMTALPNAGDAIHVGGASFNTIRGNLISGNTSLGVSALLADSTLVQGNRIGTTLDDLPLPNAGGVSISDGNNNTIGGPAVGALNVISGNGRNAVAFIGGTGNQVVGNLIGTDSTGAQAVPNGTACANPCPAVGVGGTDMLITANVISGNRSDAVWIEAERTILQTNRIGTASNGRDPLGNGGVGLRLGQFGNGARIGGDAQAGNTIAFNVGAGIYIGNWPVTGNLMRGNSMFSNGALGIDLSPEGVTPNDPLDADSGANELQNSPVLSVDSGGTIRGTLESKPDRAFTIEFFRNRECDASGYGEGETPLGTMTVHTDLNGEADFVAPFVAAAGDFITATATDPEDNTSEFSVCAVAQRPTPTPVPPIGIITGRAYYDANGNGRRDGGEHNLSGWTVFLDANSNGVLDNPAGDGMCSTSAPERCTETDLSGTYAFALPPGVYRAREVRPAGWRQTSTNPSDLVIPASGRSFQDIDFGNVGVGDCDGNRNVTIDEIIRGVNIALGNQALSMCPLFDGTGDGEVTIDELITAVNNALTGIPVPGTPTVPPTPTPSPGVTPATPTPTPSASPTTGPMAPVVTAFTCNGLADCLVEIDESFTLQFSFTDADGNASTWHLTARRGDGTIFDIDHGAISPLSGNGTITRISPGFSCPSGNCPNSVWQIRAMITDTTDLQSELAVVNVTVLGAIP